MSQLSLRVGASSPNYRVCASSPKPLPRASRAEAGFLPLFSVLENRREEPSWVN